MTVAELIAAFSKLPPNADVCIETYNEFGMIWEDIEKATEILMDGAPVVLLDRHQVGSVMPRPRSGP